MWRLTRRRTWVSVLLLCLMFLGACSSQAKHEDEFLIGTEDPFTDPFFANTSEWDSSVLKQSEVLSPDVQDAPDEPKTWREKSEQALMGAVMVGGGVAKLLFLPFLGF